ncbi:MAG TPA: LuxR family transcriptional regulator [Oxalobacteraceae bacterium]|jgi:DNA-binding CsgD family transcriptional regulator|nr:LuxR family transcriptional regulator [Oxalobacteraceae bacterium]HCN88392.1 LuxR family transcriptional regulator [Oxalobacteraceae bacterium]
MKAWLDDHLNALLSIDSEQELFNQLAAIAKDMGFEYCAYGIQMPVPVSRPAVVMFNNYAKEWQECYQKRGYLEVDPTVRHGLRNTLPIVWSPQVFESVPELWEEARGHGLHFGWAQSSRDASGTVGLLTLARSEEQLTESELYANKAKMAWLTQFAHAGMARLVTPRYIPEMLVTMTSREKEVLRWTAEGKTAYEIGQILAVSERTVNFHINNVVSKLGASNKTQAAVKAATLGMLL